MTAALPRLPFTGLIALAALSALLIACGSSAETSPSGAAVTGSEKSAMLIDTDTSGNTATSYGDVQPCRRVEVDQDFEVDVLIAGVKDLLAWEMEFEYYPSLVSVAARDVKLFSAANAGSSVFDVSESVPDTDGHYALAAADTADPPAPDTGSGVLARLRLHSRAAGVSPLAVAPLDLDADGKADRGVSLTNVDGDKIGDANGDAIFDGTVQNASIAIGQDCPAGAPVAFQTPVPLQDLASR